MHYITAGSFNSLLLRLSDFSEFNSAYRWDSVRFSRLEAPAPTICTLFTNPLRVKPRVPLYSNVVVLRVNFNIVVVTLIRSRDEIEIIRSRIPTLLHS